jgi:hypothetical protein
MKKSQILVLLALAGSSTAFAAPRESVTFTAVPSYARQADAGNAIMTATFTGSDAGGSYSARFLTITGQLTRIATGTYFTEASILVTPPTGTPFIMQPFNTPTNAVAGGPAVNVGATPPNSYTIPVSAITTAGTWTFEFFERYDDTVGGADSTWDTVTITMDDATPPAAAPIGPVGHTFNNALISGLTGAPGFDQTFTAPAGTSVVGVRLRAQGTGMTNPTTNNTTSSTNAVRIRVTPPGAAALAAGVVFATYGESTGQGELIISLAAPIDSGAGNWRVEGFESAAGYTTLLHSLAIELLPLQTPAATGLGAVVANTQLTGTASLAAGQTKWFTFTLNDALAAGINKGLQIDTEGSTTTDGTAQFNTSIGLFSGATGARVATDFTDGTQSLGTLTFGTDNHPAPGDGLPYNGRDGAALATGLYYVAVTAGDTGIAYQPGLFGVTNTSTQTGDVTLHVRLVDPGVQPPAATDLGVIGSTPVSTTLNFGAPAEIQWLKFTTLAACDPVTNYLDIDTEGSALTGTGTNPNDTMIGLFSAAGAIIATDDDSGSGALSQLTFGATGNPRPAVGNGLAYTGTDGANGANVVAGTYYLAVGIYGVTFTAGYGAVHFDSGITTGSNGPITVNFNSNLPGGGPACGLADVGGVGGVAGADNHLDNNDFVVFIDFFFNHNPIADQGSTGGAPGADGAWDNNDFVVFIDNFFTAPASCR